MTYLPTSTPGRCSNYFFCRKESLLLLNSPLSFYGVLLYGTFTIDKLLLSGEFGFGFVYHNCQTSSDRYSRWKKMINGTGLTALDENVFAHVELFILEQVVHRFQGLLKEKIQSYFKRDTQSLNHNMWIISCMIISCCYCLMMAFIVRICAAFSSSYL